VAEGLSTIDESALDRVPDRELFDGAMRGMVGVLDRRGDPHSKYLNREDAEPMRTEIRQQFGGIGVRIGFEGEPPKLTIVEPPMLGSPASLKKLRVGDRILSIDGHTTAAMKMIDVLQLMRGKPGESVRLTVLSDSDTDPRTVDVVREVINIESVVGDRRSEDGGWHFRLEGDPRIAHIRVVSFGERTAEELKRVLEHAVAQGVQGVVLDLRDNPGGSLDASVAVCGHFLPAGKMVVQTRGRDGQVLHHYETVEEGEFLDLPLVVMVNDQSASAAEIVAACLQDHGRAVVAGQRSHGKGTVQQMIPLETGESLLKLTWASFWRPSDAKIHRAVGEAESATWGVMPDAGLERPLTNAEREAYVTYRENRDKFQPVALGADSENNEESAPADFADVQLELATKHLRAQLGAAQ
jgi:carboxyl-terminal processing protease